MITLIHRITFYSPYVSDFMYRYNKQKLFFGQICRKTIFITYSQVALCESNVFSCQMVQRRVRKWCGTTGWQQRDLFKISISLASVAFVSNPEVIILWPVLSFYCKMSIKSRQCPVYLLTYCGCNITTLKWMMQMYPRKCSTINNIDIKMLGFNMVINQGSFRNMPDY